MSKELGLRSLQGGSVGTQGKRVKAGMGQTADNLSWGPKAEHFRDLPTIFREHASKSTELLLRREAQERQGRSPVHLPTTSVLPGRGDPLAGEPLIASGVRRLEKAYRRGEEVVQRKLGWKATPTGILIVTVERALQARGDGKLAPQGEWLIEHRRTYRNQQGPALRRSGRVSAREEGAALGEGATTYVAEAESAGDAFQEGATTMSFLPLAVRGDLVAQVPQPTYFDGRILGNCDAQGEVIAYEVSLLRMDDGKALVVQATRGVQEDFWQVVQATYTLTPALVESHG